MNDGTISATPSPLPQNNAASTNVTVKIDSLPPDIPVNKIISGEVIASDKGQTSIRTDRGVVVLDTEIDFAIGQKVNLKIQQMLQQSVPVRVAELTNLPVEKSTRPQAPVQVNPVMQDKLIVHDPSPFEEYKPLQALVSQMPDILTDETVDVLFKTVLNLPINKALPQSLQEGLSKLTQLTGLLSQANLLAGNEMKAADQAGGLQQNIIAVVQKLFQNFKSPSNPLLNQSPQPFIQLQSIQPGQMLSPNILVEMKQQLMNVLQSPIQAEVPQEIKPGLLSMLPSNLSGLINKAGNMMQSITGMQQTNNASMSDGTIKPAFTTPMVGLVLGNAMQDIPKMNSPVLVFMQMPGTISGETARQFIGFVSPQMLEGQAQQTLLPGSVIVTAVSPQGKKDVQFTILPQQILPEVIETFMPLNPSLGESWPVLDEIWDQAMAQQSTHPEVLANLRQIIPSSTTQQMPPAMLFFMSVLKNGFSAEWIPEKHLAILEGVDKESLINMLNRDLNAIRARLEDPLPVDAWRPLPIPMQLGDQLMRLQWFYRHPENDYQESGTPDEQGAKKRKTRFLLNVPKTGLGDIQIDGLVQERKLDLILRTEDAIMSHMEKAIRGRYTAVLETTGMVGGIDFQSGRHHYVHV